MQTGRREGAMERHDLERIQFVTRHFGELKGLAGKVPFGLVLVGFGAGTWFGFYQGVSSLLLAGVVALLVKRQADLYYLRRFGYVEPSKSAPRQRSHAMTYVLGGPPLRSVAIILAALALALVSWAFVSAWFHSMLCPWFGGRLIVSWVRKRCPPSQAYYPVLGALLLAFARWNGGPMGVGSSLSPTNDLACGVVLILAGLLDHRQLVRLLSPISIEEPELAGIAEENR